MLKRWDVPSSFLFIILLSCGNHIYIQLSTLEKKAHLTKLWRAQCVRPLHSQSRDGPPWGLWGESGTEVCAMMWTEGIEAGLEAAVLVLDLEDSWTHNL